MLRLNYVVAGSILFLSFLLYLATMAPTVSFWDCGEFIATAYIMGVPHPPGSPLYLLVARLFSMLPLFENIGARVNIISPITSALAVFFLYLIIVYMITSWRGPVKTVSDALITYGAGAIGALTFMVTDSHWFNAVEAEVYAVSTFLTAMTVWLILRWSQKDDSHSHIRYILLLAYLFGLAAGIHLLNLLTLPFVGLIIYFRRREFSWRGLMITVAITLVVYMVIHLGVINGLPQIALSGGIPLAVVIVAALSLGSIWAVRRRNKNASIILVSLLLVVVGYSTYATIFIRSHQDPAIDENNPETTRRAVAYLEREQYGNRSMLSMLDRAQWTPASKNLYSGVGDYVWNYQIRKMYARYFLWQFAGRGLSTDEGVSAMGANAQEDGVHWTRYGLPLALLVGIFGLVHHMRRDWHRGLAVLTLFLATGLLIILYLNQPDPQPRERDYSYVGSFFAWSIWIGIGVAGLLEFLSQRLPTAALRRAALPAALGLILVSMPGVMLLANYHQHDRTGNYVAWDYSYNLLNSCRENAIIFTNGDNDTFPLWYLQEVEKVRKDVRVINLSLLNTDWYITQLRDFEPRLPLKLTDQDIQAMTPIPWETKTVKVPVNPAVSEASHIEWSLAPTFGGRYIRTQDRMIVQLIKDLNWTRPIYFAVTVAPENKIGLDKYLEMQGLVFELMPTPVTRINLEKLRENLLDTYRYRNLNDPSVYYNPNIQRLMQNLRANFLQLVVDGVIRGEPDVAQLYLDTLAALIPESVIPITNKHLYQQVSELYGEAGDSVELRRRITELPQEFLRTPQDYLWVGSMYTRVLNDDKAAETIFSNLYSLYPRNGEVVGSLVQFYRSQERNPDAARVLREWLSFNAQDQGARQLLRELQAESASGGAETP